MGPMSRGGRPVLGRNRAHTLQIRRPHVRWSQITTSESVGPSLARPARAPIIQRRRAFQFRSAARSSSGQGHPVAKCATPEPTKGKGTNVYNGKGGEDARGFRVSKGQKGKGKGE